MKEGREGSRDGKKKEGRKKKVRQKDGFEQNLTPLLTA